MKNERENNNYNNEALKKLRLPEKKTNWSDLFVFLHQNQTNFEEDFFIIIYFLFYLVTNKKITNIICMHLFYVRTKCTWKKRKNNNLLTKKCLRRWKPKESLFIVSEDKEIESLKRIIKQTKKINVSCIL